MQSIKQNTASPPLPDFRNFGVMLRMLLGVNLLALMAALVLSDGLGDWATRFVDAAAWVQPLLLFNFCLLALLSPLLQHLPPFLGALLVLVMATASSASLHNFWPLTGGESAWPGLLRAALLGFFVAGILLAYFALRARAFSPALTEARLQALTARIQPHFLFNSLNAVLSLIRIDPKRAETALEELSELFRVLMRDQSDLRPLADEITLCQQYLNLEKLRLGERLQVDWTMGEIPVDLMVPPLMLQPLLENAVYHGIEPSVEPGILRVRFTRHGDTLQIDLANPCLIHENASSAQQGQHIALANIRERLALYYDLEARLETGKQKLENGSFEFRVHIVLPCRGQSLWQTL